MTDYVEKMLDILEREGRMTKKEFIIKAASIRYNKYELDKIINNLRHKKIIVIESDRLGGAEQKIRLKKRSKIKIWTL